MTTAVCRPSTSAIALLGSPSPDEDGAIADADIKKWNAFKQAAAAQKDAKIDFKAANAINKETNLSIKEEMINAGDVQVNWFAFFDDVKRMIDEAFDAYEEPAKLRWQ